MRDRLLKLCLWTSACLVLSPVALAIEQEHASIPISRSQGEPIELTAELDFPDQPTLDPTLQWPLVLMVPGSSPLDDRDVLFGKSGTPGDLIYSHLGSMLLSHGMAVMRFDPRGISCNRRTVPVCKSCMSENERAQHYAHSCVRAGVRAGVTRETIRSDIEAVYDWASSHPRIDKRRIAIIGQYEASIHLSILAESGRVRPIGMLFIGAILESPSALFHWQQVERMMRIMDWDKDRNLRLSDEEITSAFESDPFLRELGIGPSRLFSPDGAWTAVTLKNFLEDSYTRARDAAFEVPSDAAYPRRNTGPVEASYDWLKMWYQTDNPLERLKHYAGKLSFHTGELDARAPASRELAQVTQKLGSGPSSVHSEVYQTVGHMLGETPIYGPMSNGPAEKIARDAQQMLGIPVVEDKAK